MWPCRTADTFEWFPAPVTLQMKFIVFLLTAKTEWMLLIVNEEFWILMKLNSGIFQGWTQVLISLVVLVFTTGTCHMLQSTTILNKQTEYFYEEWEGIKQFQCILEGFKKKISKMPYGCHFYWNLVGAQEIWSKVWGAS